MASANAASLGQVCTVANIQAALPANGTLLGINPIPSAVTANAVYNATINSKTSDSSGVYSYCNVTVAYAHVGKNDNVVLKFAFPSPSAFKKRFYGPGGGGYSLASDATGGLFYGAASGVTDGGYDAFSNAYNEVVLYGNGSINWDATYMFGYQALGEMTLLGKALTRNIYGMETDDKLYTYFEGCSDGGREGMSQVQRWGEEYDGVIAGAPAFHFAQQQVLHVFPSAVQKTLNYYPPPCEIAKIVNATIAACDSLDGRKDGVVSRTELCQLNLDLTTLIGEPYYCASSNQASSKRQASGGSSNYQPEQNGTVSAEAVELVKTIFKGLHNSEGERAYVAWQMASDLYIGTTVYNEDTEKWELSIPPFGGMYVRKFIQLLDLDNLSDLDNVTYDTLVEWMKIGTERYFDSLQTTYPDLSRFQKSGGKLIYYHGESDPGIPAASSANYWQYVRSAMYGNLSDEESLKAIQDWYQFYLIPGAGHCGRSPLQPGPYPQNNMDIMIDWVENGKRPTRLNATVSSGANKGEIQLLCQWPTRPLWKGNSDEFDCVNDQESIDNWTYEFPAFKMPI